MLRDVLFSAKAIFDSESPVMDPTVNDVSLDATSDKGGTCMRAWIIDGVKTVGKVINTDHLSVNFKAFGFTNGNVCRPTNNLKFSHRIHRVGFKKPKQLLSRWLSFAKRDRLPCWAQLKMPSGGEPAL